MYVRRFSPDIKAKIPGGHPGLYGAFILFNQADIPTDPAAVASFAERMHGMPLTLDAPVRVEAMYFEPHARLDEHSAPFPILFIVTGGRGMLRIGGPSGETREIQPGDAVIWPERQDHMVWTEDDPLEAIVIQIHVPQPQPTQTPP
ncbi:MAG TPA: cupin domain-containing protein [Ktedonobacterales bacterium]